MSQAQNKIFQEQLSDFDPMRPQMVLFAGLFGDAYERLNFAHSFKQAGDRLADICLSSDEDILLIYPILYNYRHSIELYVKAIVGPQGHRLKELLDNLIEFNEKNEQGLPPKSILDLIREFDEHDERSTAFRYQEIAVASYNIIDGSSFPYYVNITHLREVMDQLHYYFNELVFNLSNLGSIQ